MQLFPTFVNHSWNGEFVVEWVKYSCVIHNLQNSCMQYPIDCEHWFAKFHEGGQTTYHKDKNLGMEHVFIFPAF